MVWPVMAAISASVQPEGVMKKLEALRILETRLATLEQEHQAELARDEDTPEEIDSRAEAKSLASVFEFLRDCKISHRDSLLRILERYLRPKSGSARIGHGPLQGAKEILSGRLKTNKATKLAAGRLGQRTGFKVHNGELTRGGRSPGSLKSKERP
jgi:hypothetical protein